MEDVLYYIGLGLLITFSLVRKAGKKSARKGAKRSHTPQSVPPPGFPTFEALFEEIEKKSSKPAPQTEPAEWSSEAQSLETIFDEEESYMQNARPSHQGATPSVASGAKQPILTSTPKEPKKSQKPTKKAQKGQNSDISEDFNLRDAVIYSEILKPKF